MDERLSEECKMAEPSNMYHHVVSTRTRFIGSSKIYFLLQRPGRGNAFHEVPIAVFKFRFHRVMENVENVSKICFPGGKNISNADESIQVKLQRNERKKKRINSAQTNLVELSWRHFY